MSDGNSPLEPNLQLKTESSSTGPLNPVKLQLKESPRLPLEAEVISPNVFVTLSQTEIRLLPVHLGNRQYRLEDFFKVEGEMSGLLELHGDLAQVKRIGQEMSAGSIEIFGNAGMHLGAGMTGGSIDVHGNASDWIGAEMTNGRIHIRGNSGGQAGAAYRGSRKGMRGGVILIDGDAGNEVGMRMRRGLICIRGHVGDFAGVQMLGGTICLCGKAGLRTGAWMTRGTILALEPIKRLPTFMYACTYEPLFLNLVLKQLRKLEVPAPDPIGNTRVRRYVGDTSGLGKGEILIFADQAEIADLP